MQPFGNLLDRRLVSGHIEYFLKASIARDHAARRIVVPPPEVCCIEGQLQTVMHQQLLLLLLDGSALRHVAHDREHYWFGQVRDRAEHNVDRKRAAVRASGDEVEAGTHRLHLRLRSVFGTICDVTFSEVLR
jgi:hypothetical protein